MYRPLYFQLPAADPAQLAKFYSDVFGWKIGLLPGMENIWSIYTGPFDHPGMNGMIMGKFMDCAVNTMEVPDVQACIETAVKHGGKVITPLQFIVGMGDFAWIADPDGNMFVPMKRHPDFEKTFCANLPDGYEILKDAPRPIHFEIPATDIPKLCEFYAKVLNWTSSKWSGPFDYYFLMTGDENSAGIDGAVSLKTENEHTVNTIGVDNLNKYLEKITALGGKQVTEAHPIEGVGLFCYCADPEGNQFGLMQFQAH